MSPIEYFDHHYTVIVGSLIIPLVSIWAINKSSDMIEGIDIKKQPLLKTILKFLNGFFCFIPLIALGLVLVCLVDSFVYRVSGMSGLLFNAVLVLYLSLAFFSIVLVVSLSKRWWMLIIKWILVSKQDYLLGCLDKKTKILRRLKRAMTLRILKMPKNFAVKPATEKYQKRNMRNLMDYVSGAEEHLFRKVSLHRQDFPSFLNSW